MIYDLLSAENADISVRKMRNSNSKRDFLHYQYSYDIKCGDYVKMPEGVFAFV